MVAPLGAVQVYVQTPTAMVSILSFTVPRPTRWIGPPET